MKATCLDRVLLFIRVIENNLMSCIVITYPFGVWVMILNVVVSISSAPIAIFEYLHFYCNRPR